MLWSVLFGTMFIAAAAGLIYLITRFHKFELFKRTAKEHRFLSWLLAAVPVAALVVCLILGLLALLEFAILAFSQVALVNLPLKKIWKNALFLIPVMGWRGLGVAALHLLFLAALYQWISVMFLLFLFLGPATLVAWTSWKLFPKLEEALLRHE